MAMDCGGGMGEIRAIHRVGEVRTGDEGQLRHGGTSILLFLGYKHTFISAIDTISWIRLLPKKKYNGFMIQLALSGYPHGTVGEYLTGIGAWMSLHLIASFRCPRPTPAGSWLRPFSRSSSVHNYPHAPVLIFFE